MNGQTDVAIKFILLDEKQGAGAEPPPPRTGAPSYAPPPRGMPGPGDPGSLAMWATDDERERERTRQRQEREPRAPPRPWEIPPPTPDERQKEQDDQQRMRYREAQQAVTGLSRGGYFLTNFGMSGMVGAAGQFLEAGQSAAMVTGASAASVAAVAGPVAVVVAALGGFALAVKGASDATEGLAKRAAEFGGGETAVARAEVDVKRTMFELDSAQKRDPMLADFTQASGDLSLSVEELKRDFLDAIIPLLTDLARDAKDVIELIKAVKDGISSLIPDELKPIIATMIREGTFPLLRLLARIGRFLDNRERRDDEDAAQQALLGTWMEFFNKPHFELRDFGLDGSFQPINAGGKAGGVGIAAGIGAGVGGLFGPAGPAAGGVIGGAVGGIVDFINDLRAP